ncbi:hypothetical protein MFIFM68171_09896 [Madurella fahalii]|uniref:Prion-inhibition and propagation HeLo domain-containing protein n=1 Tax=Madurella fahalii TaxID=1157608 RepID=A0ABQ0GPL5_9PEZI
MADIVGLSVGIISLAGLFSNCVDAFAYVKAGQSLERNLAILLVKLDVEKARLVSWGNAVGIARALNNGRDAILNDPAIEATIRSVLESIRLLLTDSKRLQDKYAVEELYEPAQITDVLQLDLISSTSLSIFRRSYNRLCNRAKHQPQIGITKRVSWAIRDREKFDELIRDLREFVDGLVDLAPIAIQSAVESRMEDDVSSLRISDLNLVEEALSSQERYQTLSDAVSEAIQAKEEGGTIDQWLNNQNGQATQPESRLDPTPATPRNIPREFDRYNPVH